MSFSTLVKDEIKVKAPLNSLAEFFIKYGSITNPQKAYHLEFVCSESYSESIKEELLKIDINSKVIERKNSFVVYIKEAESILKILGYIGAHQALLEFENIRIFKSVRSDINRKLNLEVANMTKIASAAADQAHYIKNVLNNPNIKLPKEIDRVAKARLDNMELSLKELANVLGLTKSCVNHRLKKIKEISEKNSSY